MISCGVDIGSRTIEVLLYDGAQIIDSVTIDTGVFPTENAAKAFNGMLAGNSIGREEITRIIATGYGRNYFKEADKVVSEIICHSAGVAYQFPNSHTIIEIGGQDSKVIQTNGNGKVANFAMNDRCAAGTGKFIEMAAKTLDYRLEDTGTESLKTNQCCEISSMCAVFAESEIIGLLHKGVQREVILRGIFKSVARRVLGLAGKLGIDGEVIFTGGVAKNIGVIEALKNETGKGIKVPSEPQITGALGAAIIAFNEAKKNIL